MLQTVAIRGYRSLREVILPLSQLSVVTGANGAGKSSLYRALRLLADCGRGEVIASLAREGGLQSALWAGPEELQGARRTGKVEGTVRTRPVSLELGFASDDFGYLVDLGMPQMAGPKSDPHRRHADAGPGGDPFPRAARIPRHRAGGRRRSVRPSRRDRAVQGVGRDARHRSGTADHAAVGLGQAQFRCR